MIRQYRYLMNPPPIDFAGFIQEASQPMNYFALQYPPTILRNPDNVKPQSVLGVTSCPVPPCHASSMPDILPPRNFVSLRAGLTPALKGWGLRPGLSKDWQEVRNAGAADDILHAEVRVPPRDVAKPSALRQHSDVQLKPPESQRRVFL